MSKKTSDKYGYAIFNPVTNKRTPCSIKEVQQELGVSISDLNHMLVNRIPIKDRGYGKYEVSNYGRVRYITKTPDKSPCLTHNTKKSNKKHYVTIHEDNKQVRLDVDKLVAQYFIAKREILEDEEIVHLDGNNENNYYKNLKVKKLDFDNQLKFMKEIYSRMMLEDDNLYPNERWKPINRENSHYQISDYRRVRKQKPNGEWSYLKQVRKGKSNILQVVISSKGNKKLESISRLVAEHFLEDFSPDKSIFHIDLNKDNNYYSNLQCIDKSSIGKMTGIMSRNLPKIVCTNILTGEHIGVYNSAREAGRMLGISRQAVSDNLNGKTKMAARKYKFAYEE